jgi:ABC-2 type transport system ATP-binding protein
VTGLPAPQIGELATRERVVLHELSPVGGSLEDAYLALTQDEVEYHAGGTAAA